MLGAHAAAATGTSDGRAPAIAAALTFVVAATGLLIGGGGRSLDYDGATTAYWFVDGSDPLAALTEQRIYNNHPLFSFLSSLVAGVTGSEDEVVLRFLPAVLLAAAAALLVWRIGRRWGLVAGITGGVVLATSPVLVDTAREVRGYSLATLAVVVMGIAVLEAIPRRQLVFGIALVAGVCTHLYVVVPAALGGYVLLRQRRLDQRWIGAFVAGAVAAALISMPILEQPSRGRAFQPSFLLDAAWEVLGASAPAVLLLGGLLVWAAVTRQVPRLACEVAVLAVLGCWILAPRDLYPRFLFWAVPGLALLIAWLARSSRTVACIALAACTLSVVSTLATTSDGPDLRSLGEAVDGHDTCAGDLGVEALRHYAPNVGVDDDCPIVVYVGDPTPDELEPDRWPVRCADPSDAGQIWAVRAESCPS